MEQARGHTSVMASFFRGVIRFRAAMVTAILAATLLAVFQLRTLHFESDTEAIIPPTDPVQHYNNVVEERFGLRDLVILGILNDNAEENGVFNPRTLGIVAEFSQKIAQLPGILAVRDEDVASVATLDHITGTADGMSVRPLMPTIPQTPADLAALKQTLFGTAMYVGWLVSQDGTGLLIMAKMESSDGTPAGDAQRTAVYRTIRTMIEEKQAAGFPEEFHVAGRGPMEATYAEDVRQDVAAFTPLVFAIVIGTLYVTYRSLRGVVLPLAVVVVSVLWTLGLMATVGVPMDFVTTMMPVVLMAVGVADGIHILSRYYDEIRTHPHLSGSEAVVVAMEEMWRPVVLTSLTTAAGFLSFLTAVLVPVRFFGLFTAVGVLAAMVFSLTFFPAVLSWLPTQTRRGMQQQSEQATPDWVTRTLTRVGQRVARSPAWVWIPVLVVIPACLFGTLRLVVDSSWIQVMHPQSPIRIADGILREKFQGTLPLYVVIEGHAPDQLKDPQLLKKLDQLQAEIETDPSVGGSLSLAEFLKRMHRAMHEDRPEMETVPTARDLIAQYLLLYSFSGDPDDFEEIVDYEYQHANVAFYLRSDHTQDIMRVVNKIQAFAEREFGRGEQPDTEARDLRDMLFLRFGRWLGNIEPTTTGWETAQDFRIGFAGPGYLFTRTNELVVAGQLASLVTSLVAVFLLTTVMFRSFTAGLINVLPISLVIIFSFGLMGLFDIPLEVGKSMTASMVIGIGVDYTIHFLSTYQRKVQEGLATPEEMTVATMVTSGKAICWNAAVVIGGFLVLLTSQFRPNFYLGAMLALNMSACLLASLTVLPVVLNALQPRFVYGVQDRQGCQGTHSS